MSFKSIGIAVILLGFMVLLGFKIYIDKTWNQLQKPLPRVEEKFQPEDVTKSPLQSYNVVRDGGEQVKSPEPESTIARTEPEPIFSLYGISYGESKSALVKDSLSPGGGTVREVKIGDEVAGGYEVADISEGRVVLKKGDKTRVVSLGERQPTHQPPSPQPAPEVPEDMPAPPATSFKDFISQGFGSQPE